MSGRNCTRRQFIKDVGAAAAIGGISLPNQDVPRGVGKRNVQPRPVDIKMIPYYAWNNREEPKMAIWLPVRW